MQRRPGHFRGVATVVAKLLHAFQPQRAYFGQKDAQQAVVIRRMVRDLLWPVEIVVCPTVREPDGLALSSRNTYLSTEERTAAGVLYRSLRAAAEAFASGTRQAETLRRILSATLATSRWPGRSTSRWRTPRRWRSCRARCPRPCCRWPCRSGRRR